MRAFEQGKDRAESWPNAAAQAAGPRVPGPSAERLILRALRESDRTAAAIRDEEGFPGPKEIACKEGILGGLRQSAGQSRVKPAESVVLFNTGSGLKYP